MSLAVSRRTLIQEAIPLAGLIVLAALLRLGHPQVIEFKRDEANLALLALDLARGVDFPLLGIGSSVGIPNSPLSVYIMALPFFFSGDPVIATQFVGLLNVLAVALVYLMMRRWWGFPGALIAALLYAASPWAVIYSRKIWAQDLLPFFILLAIWAGIAGFIEGKRWGQLLHLPLMLLAALIHYAAFALLPLALLLIGAGRTLWKREAFISLLLVGLIALPFGIGAARAALLNVGTLQTLFERGGTDRSLEITLAPVELAAVTISGIDLHSLAGPDAYQDYLAAVPDAYPVFGLLAGLALLSLAWLVYRSIKGRDARTRLDGILLLWTTLPIAAFSLTWTRFYPHYLIPMIPAAFMVIGAAISDLWKSLAGRNPLRMGVFVVFGAALLSITLLQAYLSWTLLQFLNVNPTPNGFGIPMTYLNPVREAVIEQAPVQVIGDVGGLKIGIDDEPTVWKALLYDVPFLRFIDANNRVYPADAALWLSRRCDVPGAEIFRLRADEEGCYAISSGPPDPLDEGAFTDLESPLRLANGASIHAYDWSAPCLRLLWQTSATADVTYTFVVHFLDSAGSEILIADAPAWRGLYWQPGDRIVSRFCAEENEAGQIAGVRLGMYWQDGANFYGIDLLDSMGAPYGQYDDVYFDR